MICPFCSQQKTEVYNSRPTAKRNRLWRRRRCNACQRQFTTYESVDMEQLLTVVVGGHAHPFRKSTLTLSLLKACDHRQDDAAYWLVETIEQKLLDLAQHHASSITKQDIITCCQHVLSRFDPIAYTKYCSYYAPDVLMAQMIAKRNSKTR